MMGTEHRYSESIYNDGWLLRYICFRVGETFETLLAKIIADNKGVIRTVCPVADDLKRGLRS